MTLTKPPESLAEIGSFGKRPLSEAERASRTAFALLWKSTITSLDEMGWAHHPGSVSQLYVIDGPSSKWALASPSDEFLYVRLNFFSDTLLRATEPNFHGCKLDGYDGMTISSEKAKRASGIESFLEARISMERLFHDCKGASAMAARLRGFVIPLIERAS